MKQLFKFSFVIVAALTLLVSCSSDDDGGGPVEFGTITAVITITQGLDDFSIDFESTTFPASSQITYINTGEQYVTGPSNVVQNTPAHTFETTNDASNLNIAFLPTASDVNEEMAIAYKVEFFVNGDKQEERNFTNTIGKISHSFLWSNVNGLNEQLIDPF